MTNLLTWAQITPRPLILTPVTFDRRRGEEEVSLGILHSRDLGELNLQLVRGPFIVIVKEGNKLP
nr:hypothetical protein [Klenkia soli]